MSANPSSLSRMSAGIVGSEILKIASQIRARIAEGSKVYNLTVGDFRPDQFPIPPSLRDSIIGALERGETNYPPSEGLLELRKSIAAFYAEYLGIEYPLSGIIVAGGVRPTIYTAYRTLLNPGDTLLYPVPSWNNNHYAWLCNAKGQPVIAGPESNFLPTAEALRPHLREAKVMILNSPLNPAGTAYSEAELQKICGLILDENARRVGEARAPLVLLYDQVYWMLTFGSVKHHNPVTIEPRMRPYTVSLDGISKAFAATGLRVGWAVGPDEIMAPFSSMLGHIGAWAPRPEQVATSRLLSDSATMNSYLVGMRSGLEERLGRLHRGFEELRAAGYPVVSMAPQSTIYLSARFDIVGRSAGGQVLSTNEAIRRFLLEEASLAIVPFQAFGLEEETGWFRLSVGAISLAEMEGLFPKLRAALDRVS